MTVRDGDLELALFARRAAAMRLEPPPLERVLAELSRRERDAAHRRHTWLGAAAVAACLALALPLRASRPQAPPIALDETECPLRAYSAPTREPMECFGTPKLVCESDSVASAER